MLNQFPFSDYLWCGSYRREVKEITPDADHTGYTIKARYWEPRQYLEAMKAHVNHSVEKAKPAPKESRAGMQLLLGVSTGLAVAAVLIKKGLPHAHHVLPQHTELLATLQAKPLIVYGACVALGLLVALFAQTIAGAGKRSSGDKARKDSAAGKKSAFDTPPVGENGRMVSVEEMAVGGSGGAEAQQGVTVEIETIRARYVVNAAGCYSVSPYSCCCLLLSLQLVVGEVVCVLASI